MSVAGGSIDPMGQITLALLSAEDIGLRLEASAEAAAAWLACRRAVGLVVRTSQTSPAEREAVRALSDRVRIASAWAHSVGTGAEGKDLDALVVVSPDAALLELVAAECRGGQRILVFGAEPGALRRLEELGAVRLAPAGSTRAAA